MSPREFTAAHGDPGEWSAEEYELYLDACAAQLPESAEAGGESGGEVR